MKEKERRLLLRALSDELSPAERKRLGLLLERSEEARQGLERMRRLEHALADAADDTLEAGFADRVMRGIHAAPVHAARREDSFAGDPFAGDPFAAIVEMLRPLFIRVAPAALALASVIAAYNIASGSRSEKTAVESAFGLPRVTVAVAYDMMLAGPELVNDQQDGSRP